MVICSLNLEITAYFPKNNIIRFINRLKTRKKPLQTGLINMQCNKLHQLSLNCKMNFIAVFVLASIFAVVSTAVVDRSAIDNESRIVNGHEAAIGQFPHQVTLRNRQNNKHFCGGAIISSKWILTAAHCTWGRLPETFTAVAGTNELANGGIAYDIKGNHLHPKYDDNISRFYYDVALLRTSIEIQFTDLVRAAKLPTADTRPNVPVTISGWGQLDVDDTDFPNKLQFLNSTTISVAKCKELVPGIGLDDFAPFLCHMNGRPAGACMGDGGEIIMKYSVDFYLEKGFLSGIESIFALFFFCVLYRWPHDH